MKIITGKKIKMVFKYIRTSHSIAINSTTSEEGIFSLHELKNE
jgi:hypothetical protein